MKKSFYVEMNLLNQPEEVILQQIAPLPVEDAMRLCQSNTQLARICQNRSLWYYWAQRDFPYFTLPPFSQMLDTRELYQGLVNEERARRGIIEKYTRRVSNYSVPDAYWIIMMPDKALLLTNALNYVARHYSGRQGYDMFVYWPDYRVAGTVSQIAQIFQEAGMRTVHVGELYQRTNGQLGYSPGEYALSEQLILDNSYNPLNPAQRTLFH